MEKKHDIVNVADIKFFVNDFYGKIQVDDLLAPIFSAVINDWLPHLEKMYAFWNAVLFGVAGFKGNPFARHAPLAIDRRHFERWLFLFRETIETNFEGEKSVEAISKSEIMAELFLSKLQHRNGDGSKVIV